MANSADPDQIPILQHLIGYILFCSGLSVQIFKVTMVTKHNVVLIYYKLEMCQYDKDAPTQGHPQSHAGILQKMKLKKRDKSIFLKKKYWKGNIF